MQEHAVIRKIIAPLRRVAHAAIIAPLVTGRRVVGREA